MRLQALPILVPDAESFVEHPPSEPTVWRGSAHLEFGLDEVEELLGHGTLHGRMVSQVTGGARQAPSAYTWGRRPVQPGFADVVRPAALTDNIAAGATTVLETVHRTWKPIGDLCRRLSLETGVPWGANAFLTPEGSQGFAHHHDTHSVLIVQTSGSKTWQLHSPVVVDPLEHQPFSAQDVSDAEWSRLREGTPFLEVVLRAGDVLWIPRGWIHNGFATDEHSLHVSFAYPTLTPYAVAQELVRRLGDDPAFRVELPWGFSRSAAVRAEVLATTSKLLAEHFTGLGVEEQGLRGEELADTWRGYHLEASRAPVESLRGPVALETPVRTVAESSAGRGWTADGSLRVHLGDAVALFPPATAIVVDALLDQDATEAWTAGALTGSGLDDAAAVELTSELLRLGLARRV